MLLTRRDVLISSLSAGLTLGGLYVDRTIRSSASSSSPSAFPRQAIELPPRLNLFVLAGQSNIGGTASIRTAEPAKNVYLFGNDYRWKPAVEPLDSPAGQVDSVSEDPPDKIGAGPGLPFGVEIQERTGQPVGLVPCTRGGTLLEKWQRSTSDQTLYGSMLKRCNAASTVGELTGLLFFQGESDAKNPADAEQWAARFRQFVTDVRSDLGDLPIVFAQLGKPCPNFDHWATVQSQQASVDLPRVSMIRTDDLALQPDQLHFTADSYIEIGKRFAQAMLKLLSDDDSG
jgi:hypothetical protein